MKGEVKYIKTKGEHTYIKEHFYYDTGGMNPFTYKQEARGFWMSAYPVEKFFDAEGDCVMESTVLGRGRKMLLQEAKCYRAGGKAEKAALELWKEREKALLDVVCRDEGLELEEAL